MKLILTFLMLLYFMHPLAYADTKDELQETGRTLANYQACAEVTDVINDPALFRYYNDMFEDSAADILYYPLNQSEIVFKAFFKSVDLLKRVDSASLASLCISRFDRLLRKMQEAKLAAEVE